MDFTDILTGVFGPVFKGIEAITSSALGKAFEALVQIFYSWLVGILETIGGWWLDVDPVGASANSGVIHTISDTTRPLAVMLGTIGLIIGFVRVGRSQGSKEDTSMLIEGLMRVAIAGGVAIPGTQLLMGFSSAFAPWVYKVIVSFAHDEAASLMSLLPQDLDNAVVGLAGLSILFIGPLMLFASIIQAMMAMGTDIAAGILSALLPITAATSVTAQGNKAFWKHVGWIISCVAFKPAAAIIYGFGVAMAIGGDLSTTDGTSNPALSMIAGLIVIVLACFSLPSMVALVAPMAGVLGSSGGRFLASAGGAAVGAAVVAAVGVASAGAGAVPAAAATGASGAAGGAAGSAAGGTAAGASTATAGTSAASSAGAGAEAAGGASSELAAGGAQASAEGSGAAGSTTASAGETTGASELGADEASATGGTPGVDADTAGSNLGAGDADAAGADSNSADGAPTSDTSAPDGSSAEPTGAQSGASTDAPDTGASTSDAAGASAPDTGASAQMSASGAEPDTSSSSNASGVAGSSSSSTGATSAETSGTSAGSDTSASSGASLSSSYSDSGSSSAPAAANGAPTTTNSTYRPRGGTAAHDAARYLQDMTRAIGDETEGAIRPEGASQ